MATNEKHLKLASRLDDTAELRHRELQKQIRAAYTEMVNDKMFGWQQALEEVTENGSSEVPSLIRATNDGI